MKKLRVTEYLIQQGNHTPEDAISLGQRCVGVTITCAPDSPDNVFVGWNENPTNKNLLEPSDSKSYGNIEGCLLDGNKLYIGFGGTGAKALVSLLNDTGDDC